MTIHLMQATDENHWDVASRILKEVALDLEVRDISLWTQDQIGSEELKRHYQLEELFLLTDTINIFGMVFIQNHDLLFWPDVPDGESIFLHKLAVLPKYRSQGFGYRIINLAIDIAKRKGVNWIRLDCDTRPELTTYYKKFGFSLVDTLRMGSFSVARYQLFSEHFTDIQ